MPAQPIHLSLAFEHQKDVKFCWGILGARKPGLLTIYTNHLGGNLMQSFIKFDVVGKRPAVYPNQLNRLKSVEKLSPQITARIFRRFTEGMTTVKFRK